MAIIRADDEKVQRELECLIGIIQDGGGGFHSKLVISSYGKNLRVYMDEPIANGREIIRVTKEILLSSNHYDYTVKHGDFVAYVPDDSLFTPLQRDLIACMTSVYNLLDKAKLHESEAFILMMKPYPGLLEKLKAGRNLTAILATWNDKVVAGLSDEDYGTFLADTFLKTRVLGYNDSQKDTAFSVLMPVIDFLNHHWCGAGFSVGQGVRQGDLIVNAQCPIEDDTECYAQYGVLDAFDTYTRYNYIDHVAPYVRSVPLKLDIPDVGCVHINSNMAGPNKGRLAKDVEDLRLYMPGMTIDEAKENLMASHILIPIEKSPYALRRVLVVFLKNIIGEDVDLSAYQGWIKDAEERILNTNIEYYEDLSKYVETLRADGGAVTKPLDDVATLCDVQLNKLRAYSL